MKLPVGTLGRSVLNGDRAGQRLGDMLGPWLGGWLSGNEKGNGKMALRQDIDIANMDIDIGIDFSNAQSFIVQAPDALAGIRRLVREICDGQSRCPEAPASGSWEGVRRIMIWRVRQMVAAPRRALFERLALALDEEYRDAPLPERRRLDLALRDLARFV